jgi:dihydrofolate reductase
MRELIVSTFLTLDGAPGGPDEDDSGGFAHGGWSVNYWDEHVGRFMDEAMSTPFDLVLRRKTYDIFAAYWPDAPEETGSKPLNEATKFVASRSHPALQWSNSVLIEGDVAEGIAALKQEDGPELPAYLKRDSSTQHVTKCPSPAATNLDGAFFPNVVLGCRRCFCGRRATSSSRRGRAWWRERAERG